MTTNGYLSIASYYLWGRRLLNLTREKCGSRKIVDPEKHGFSTFHYSSVNQKIVEGSTYFGYTNCMVELQHCALSGGTARCFVP